MKQIPAVLADRLYVPKSLIDPEDFETVLTHHLYDERSCKRCDNAPERFNAICALCPSYKGSRTFHTETKLDIDGRKKTFVGLPIGGAPKFLKRLGIDRARLAISDFRSVVKSKNPLKFTGKLYEGEVVNGAKTAHQQTIVSEVLDGLKKRKRGFCILSPRAGKTVIATNVICRTKLRTLFVAADSALLDQFIDTLKACTDFKQKPKAAGIAHKPEDFKQYGHVVCTTWQALMERHGSGRLDAVWDSFGLVVVDEVHLESSPEFFTVINNINAKYFLGLTATLRRKDGSEVSSIATFGQILAEEDVPALVPTVYAYETKILSKCKSFVKLVTALTTSSRRNEAIVKLALSLVQKDPRRHVLIVSTRQRHILALTALINQKAEYMDEVADGRWPSPLAVAYHGRLPKEKTKKRKLSQRAQVLHDVKQGKYRITVAQNTLVKYGVNVPLWTDIILTIPMSSKISPDPEYHQLTLRPCTPAPNKPKPGIHTLVDVNSLSEGCFISGITKSATVLNYDLHPSVGKILATRQTKTAEAAAARILRRPW